MANADRIIELLHEAKARPPGAEREHFLAEACRDEPELKEQILSLLDADADEGKSDFLKITRIIRPTIPVMEKPGDRIGRYKLLEQIGEGGCGVVYMADQEEPVRRRVALKVIKLGMDTKQVIARFEAERQALAMMDHPNIAKIFDAGVTGTPVAAGILPAVEPGFQPGGNSTGSLGRVEESATVAGSGASPGGRMPPSTAGGTPAATLSAGRPYFVMELVRGIKITDYCDQNNLSTKERLELFIQVCQAIQHAHQKGIIHRDIKPSNILVTQHDDVAVPKVIDFGIAKATVGQLTDKTVFTAFAQFIGTPAYMSPEQAQMSGLDVDTRADIYSLGVLLYELLTGHTPFDAKELLAAGMDEMRRKIREDEPAKPSTCLSTMQAMDLTTVARHRHVEPPRLIHLIRGDLDWLVMKCLEKDRTRRYETANGLAVDLQRHLNNEPVVACPPTNLYRFQKLVRRNKLTVAAGAAVITALVLGLGISTWMFFKEKQAYQRAVAAEQEQARLRRYAEAEVAEGRRLDSFLVKLAERLRQDRNLTNAEAVLRRELEMERKLSGDEHPFVANSLRLLAAVLSDSGKSSEAEAMFQEALDMCRKLSGHENPELATALSWLGAALSGQGKHAEAEAMVRETLAMRRKLLGNEHPHVANSLFFLGTALWYQNKHTEAERSFREALAMYRKLLGNEHRDVANSLGWLGTTLSSQDKHAEAEAVCREALAMWRKLLGHEHPDVAKSLRQLAAVLRDSGKASEAEMASREALALLRRLPADDEQLVATLAGLTQALLVQQKFAEAEPPARECLALREKQIPDDWLAFNARSLLGGSLLGQKKYADAEPLLLSAYEGMKQREDKIPANGKVRLQESLQRLVQLYEATGQSEKAGDWNKKLAEFDQAEAKKKAAVPKP